MEKVKYDRKAFLKDLVDPKVPHIKSLGRFANFYNELGKMPQQKKQKYLGWRMDWIKPKGTILELGCHAGFDLIHYARKGFMITGVDVSKSLIKQARERISKQPREVRARILTVNSFIEKLDIKKYKADTILLTETLEHVINPLKILKISKELLNKGGSIFITSPDEKRGNNSHVRGISKKFMQVLAEKAGLRIVHQEKIKKIIAVELKSWKK